MLKPGRAYRLRVRAHNSCGFGPFSEACSCSSLPAPPSAPGKPSFSGKNSNSVKLKWALPEEDYGAVVTAYTLQLAGPDGQYSEAYHGEARAGPVWLLHAVTGKHTAQLDKSNHVCG